MELEFDKEIDALLRKVRPPAVASGSAHVDTDAMNAFVEGALPDAIRKTYTAHFADCDSCRKALSHLALLNEPLAMKAAAGAPLRAVSPRPPKAVPWYRSLFRSPALVAAMGVLVLAFGGVLVYLVTQRGNSTESSVAMQKEVSNAAPPIPYAGIDSNSNSAATSSMSNAAVSNSMSTAANRSAANTSSNASTNAKQPPSPSASGSGGAVSSTTTAQPPSAAAPTTVDGLDAGGKVPEDKPKTSTEERKDQDTRAMSQNRDLSDDRLAGADAASKKAVGGSLRSASPVLGRNEGNMQSEMAVTRRAGGKTFRNSNGAWYDSAYHGQSTTNVRRGSDEFKKLDAGLRSIANDLGGVVVIVWKDKAYRIQ
jgi:hypothetical protein